MAHLHELRDMDTHYVIDPLNNWVITNANPQKNALMLGDHDSEVFTFEIPRYCEGHDMTTCGHVRVHYMNISSADKNVNSKDIYRVVDMALDESDPDTLVFTWTIHGNATKYAGSLNFRILFECVDENSIPVYKKWTDVYKGVLVKDGFCCDDTVFEDNRDILAEWEARIEELEDGGTGSAPQKGVDYWTDEDKAEIVDDVLAEIPSTGGSGSERLLVEITKSGEQYTASHTFDEIMEARDNGYFVEARYSNTPYYLASGGNVALIFSKVQHLMYSGLVSYYGFMIDSSNTVTQTGTYLKNEDFIINVEDSDGTVGNAGTADKTYSEIVTAYNNGRTCIVKDSYNNYYPLTQQWSNTLYFKRVNGSLGESTGIGKISVTTVAIGQDGTVTFKTETLQNKYPIELKQSVYSDGSYTGQYYVSPSTSLIRQAHEAGMDCVIEYENRIYSLSEVVKHSIDGTAQLRFTCAYATHTNDGTVIDSILVSNGGGVSFKTVDLQPRDFVITVTGNESDGYTADKTLDEINFAYVSGRTCIVKYDELIYHLDMVHSEYHADYVSFSFVKYMSSLIMLSNITISYGDQVTLEHQTIDLSSMANASNE